MSDQYNAANVYTTTPRNNQHIFMDATFNAQFDVDVLASAFNMDKANFMGRLHLIDYLIPLITNGLKPSVKIRLDWKR